ncbi:hypothetical protein, variant [Exophiala mesophila]|uniref:NAD(P)-binding protein n=1 Tax=Exophiala mesophila TaxID=212818 RepID=A0A0D1Y1U9_EXOME|nr:uncharacterized protein PV10_02255 [Exophiala mesophila]XP_016226066.1 hypothetical protein, variant [Exophiala mesophila]KIV94491.1 hypothetical protein PV10_02255 [Exophiala mesophila]KIV94492.1 hypothetical protein, variant [Exophiala mesophila]
MVSWAVTGATRGIGFGFIENLSANSKDEVFALIRSRATAGPLEKLATERKNVHIIVTDIADPQKLAEAAAEVAKVTAGSLDVLILNASSPGPDTGALSPTAFHGKEEALANEINENVKTNVISNVFVVNAFLDLIRNGKEKKISFITSPSGDVEFTRITGLSTLLGYSVSKAGVNMLATKYAVELAPEGIKTVALSPGWVDTDASRAVTGDPEVRKFMLNAFHKLDKDVEGPISVDESIALQLKVIQDLNQENSGKTLTHRGNSDGWF